MARGRKKAELKVVESKPSNILTDDQQAALFFSHKNKVIELKEKMASVSGSLRAVYKAAKADGYTKKEIDFAISLENDEDDKVQKQRLRENQIAAWLGVALGTQGELALEPDRRPVEERAAAEGKKAGMNGEALKPPYAPGAPGYDAYVEAWHVGQAAIFSIQKGGGELLRPVSEDKEDGADDFNEAAESDFGDDTYQPGDEVDVGGEDDGEDEFVPPDFLKREATEEA